MVQGLAQGEHLLHILEKAGSGGTGGIPEWGRAHCHWEGVGTDGDSSTLPLRPHLRGTSPESLLPLALLPLPLCGAAPDAETRSSWHSAAPRSRWQPQPPRPATPTVFHMKMGEMVRQASIKLAVGRHGHWTHTHQVAGAAQTGGLCPGPAALHAESHLPLPSPPSGATGGAGWGAPL